jgi:hypothetical protein
MWPGHVFCYDCISKTIQQLSPLSTSSCPTCRASFPLGTYICTALVPQHPDFVMLYSVSINTTLVPAHLRPFFLAPFRRLYLDEQPAEPTAASPAASSSKHVAAITSLKSENAALRQSCAHWRRRAETHAATALGLAGVLRMARMQIRAERDALRKREQDLARRAAALGLDRYARFTYDASSNMI